MNDYKQGLKIRTLHNNFIKLYKSRLILIIFFVKTGIKYFMAIIFINYNKSVSLKICSLISEACQ